MPGRSGSLIQGAWTEGGNAVLANLTVDDRSGNQPIEYVATESIEFLPGFESGEGDAFVAYIDPEATIGSGGEGSGLYRYGFNGKENDNEVKGEGSQIEYGDRIHDTRLGRFLSVDLLTKDYPWYTPYQFAGNTPIWAVDLEGREPMFTNSPEFLAERAMSRSRHPNASELFILIEAVPNALFRNPIVEGTVKTVTAPLNIIDYTNRNGHERDPTIRKQNDEMAKEAAGDVLMAWGGAKIFGITIQGFGNVGIGAVKVLSKSERINIFLKQLSKTNSVGTQDDAIKLINKTLDEVEDTYSGVKKANGIPDRDDGRMYGILDDKYVKTLEDGTKLAETRGNRILLKKDGGFEIQTKDGSKTLFSKQGKTK